MQRQKERAYTEYLVMRAKTGDRSGYNLLAEHYERRLLSFAMRLTGDTEMARDASQEAWLDITRGLMRLSNARLFQAWAYKIVSRRCADQIRKTQRRRKTNSAYAAEPKQTQTKSEIAEQHTDRNRILGLIKNLPEVQRLTMILFYAEDLGVAEIAHITDVPLSTVKSRLSLARNKIRAEIEEGDKHV